MLLQSVAAYMLAAINFEEHMTAVVYSSARFSARNPSGVSLVGGKLHTYQNGTEIEATTYSDSAGTVNTNPVVLNERGEAVVYVDPMQVYTFVLRDSVGALIWSQDGVAGISSSVDFNAFKSNLTQAGGGGLVGYGPGGRTVFDRLIEETSIWDYAYLVTTRPESDPGTWDWQDAASAAISAADGKRLDLCGLVLPIRQISKTLGYGISIRNGTFVYTGVPLEFAIKLSAPGIIEFVDVEVDGNNNVAKVLDIAAIGNAAEVYATRLTGRNAHQAEDSGLAAAIRIDTTGSNSFKRVELDFPRAFGVSSGKSVGPVGRGILVGQSDYTVIRSPQIEDVGPYQDGDGVYIYNTLNPQAIFRLTGGSFVNCQKRAVKSQITDTEVRGLSCARTQAFPIASGQVEVDLQYGGLVDGLGLRYADGAAPQLLIAGSVFGSGGDGHVRVSNVSAIFEDPTDSILAIVGISQSDDEVIKTAYIDNVRANCTPRSFLFLYGTGLASQNDIAMDGILISNSSCIGFDAGAIGKSVAFLTRGDTAYVKANVSVKNCNFGDDYVPFAYLDPTPGSTSYLALNLILGDGCTGFFTSAPSNLDNARTGLRYGAVAENASLSFAFPLNVSRRGAVKVVACYASARDSTVTKLYTEGIVFAGATVAQYIETAVGNKAQAQQGSLSIAISGQGFTVSKLAGSGTAGGELTVMIQNASALAST